MSAPQECYREEGSQDIRYPTGVPATRGALMMLTGEWTKPGVYTVEECNPDPFLDALDKYGLPRSENHDPVLVDWWRSATHGRRLRPSTAQCRRNFPPCPRPATCWMKLP